MNTAAVCIGVLGLLVFGLGIGVSLTRGATNTIIGYNPDPSDRLYKMVRAHGNATEFNPMLAILMLYLATRQPSAWVEWVFVVAAVSRVLHAAGMIMSPSLAKPQPLRAIGAVGTFVAGLVLSVMAIVVSL
jgi:uncharacterized membrane protein YecN with MAPEG domain